MTPQQEIEAYAIQKLKDWALDTKGWTFGWNTRRRSFGLCSVSHKMIYLSSFLFPTVEEDDHKDTVLHEIAHALDLEERGYSNHDRHWKRKAIMVGARPKRCGTVKDKSHIMAQAKYILVCPNGHENYAHRRPKVRRSCGKCCPGRFNEAFLLDVVQQY